MSKCANCGTELEPGTKFCSQCGAAVPQTKVCPECGSEQKPEAKFCSNCGHRFGAPAAAGGAADMGLKIGHSTVMGDIKNAVNYVTNVTNADETRHVVKCHVCGKVLTVIETYTCPACGKTVCIRHFDEAMNLCKPCADAKRKSAEETFVAAIRDEVSDAVLADSLPVALYRVDRALRHKDPTVAEKELAKAERIWPESVQVHCRRVVLHSVLYRVFGEDVRSHLEKTKAILREMGAVEGRLDRSWTAYAANLVEIVSGGNAATDADEILYAAICGGFLPEPYRGPTRLRSAEKIYERGCRYRDGDGCEQSYEKALADFRQAAEEGCADAMNDLGALYYLGRGVAQSYEESAKWVRQAAELGEPMAQKNLACCYASGQGVEQSYDMAVKWLRQSAGQGCAAAQCKLGDLYAEGQGVAQSHEESVKWYRLAAAQEDGAAQYKIGLAYERGLGVVRSCEEAARWYQQSAEQGNMWAQNNLAVLYANGRGVAQWMGDAIRWYRAAAKQGHEGAQTALRSMNETW